MRVMNEELVLTEHSGSRAVASYIMRGMGDDGDKKE